MIAHRIYLGPVSEEGLARIIEAVRSECRSDGIAWYVLERAKVGHDDHPRNPGHRWAEIEVGE